jgi:hypothetical protein
VTAARWAVWSLQRSDGSGLQVGEGTKAEAQASARRRNESAVRQKVTSVVFVALPVGKQPTWEDIPPAPEPPEVPGVVPDIRKTRPRTLIAVQNDLVGLHDPNSSVLPHFRSVRARALAEEAFELGKAESAAGQRKALGKAWSVALEVIPDEFWKFLPYDDPELYRRWRAFLLGGSDD